MIVIENNKYFVKFNLMGGQISRFRDKLLDLEYIYDLIDDDWGYSTPTLFPIIGSSYDQKYHFNGQVTSMKNHGILRDKKFELISHKNNEVLLRLSANQETLKEYPYYFNIDIKYTLEDNKLIVEYEISNEGVIDMPFNFGLHPAFKIPIQKDLKFDDYDVVFSSETKLAGHGPFVNEGLISKIKLDKELFKEFPTWIYHNLSSPKIGLTDGKHGVWVSAVGFPITAIWSKPSKSSKFVCLEPWLGIAKKIEKDLAFKDRDAVMNLKENRKLLLTYTIEVY